MNLKTEQKMTSAIMYVSSDEIPGMLVTTGHDEIDASALTALMEDNAFSTGEVNLLTDEIPENTKMCIRDRATAEMIILGLERGDLDYRNILKSR